MFSKSIWRNPFFWIALSGISAASIVFSIKFFPKTFPIVNLDLTIDRDDALNKALELSKKNSWLPHNGRQAASFSHDSQAQMYIELEAGGSEMFKKVIEEKFYAPYTWIVRNFKEQDIHETYVYLRPDGKPYGYMQVIPEAESGPALSREQARTIALENLKENWNFDISQFTSVEESQETKPSGRIDHTFVYEAKHKKIGEAEYRLKLIVQGDKRTALHLNLKVPESFKRRFKEMRSTNEMIARVSSIIMIILYFFGGVLIGLYFLITRRRTIWIPALIWGGILALFEFLNILNQTPLQWLSYNSATSMQTFLSQLLFSAIASFIFSLSTSTLLIVAAEGLSRWAFGSHPQFFKAWNVRAASSVQIIGRTIGAYLLVGIQLAIVIIFYFTAFKYFGWWWPSENMFDPNILSHYLPWLAPVSQALRAGFIEECLYRAIPLSCAYLVGKKIGWPRLMVSIFFVLQALIFGAAHATYPAQPAYARLVELIIPSFIFGGIFLQFGLLPAIITHVVFDIALMSIPIFISTAPGIWIQQLCIVLFGAVPLVVLIQAVARNKWHELTDSFYNFAWRPTAKKEALADEPLHPISGNRYPFAKILIFVLLSLGTWAYYTQFTSDAIPLTLSRNQALDQAKKVIQKINPQIAEWKSMARIADDLNPSTKKQQERLYQHIFSWRTAGKSTYKNLLGTYLLPPAWLVRFVRFKGSAAEKAEEYRVYILGDGKIFRQKHKIPESAKADTIDEATAQSIAKYKILPEKPEFTLVSIEPKKHPNRQDWLLTYSTQTTELEKGQKRIKAKITGKTISDHFKYIFVPQKWKREYLHELSKNSTLYMYYMLGIFLLIAFLLVYLFATKTIAQFSIFAAGLFAGILLLKTGIQTINLWPAVESLFKTATEYSHQVFAVLSSFATTALFKSLSFGSLAGLLIPIKTRAQQLYKNVSEHILIGLASGSLLGAFYALNHYFGPQLKPLWPTLSSANAFSPSLSLALINLTQFIEHGLIALLIYVAIDHFSQAFTRYKLLTGIFFVLLGLGSHSIEHLHAWLISGVLLGLLLCALYVILLRFCKAAIPIGVGSFMILQSIQHAIFAAYPGAILGSAFSILFIAGAGWYWSELLDQQ